MKRITHLSTGLALSTFIPQILEQAIKGNPVPILSGVIAGILPDIIDIRIIKYLYYPDLEIIPDPINPSPSIILKGIYLAINHALIQNKPIVVHLGTIKIDIDKWQKYELLFNPCERKIKCTIGSLIDSKGNEIGKNNFTGREYIIKLHVDISIDYKAKITVDEPDGIIISFYPVKNTFIKTLSIPWRRRYTHSIPVMLVFSAILFMIAGIYSAVSASLAFIAHIFLDQLGFIAGYTWWPLKKKCSQAIGIVKSDDPFLNFTLTTSSFIITFYNLALFHGYPVKMINMIIFFWILIAVFFILSLTKNIKHLTHLLLHYKKKVLSFFENVYREVKSE